MTRGFIILITLLSSGAAQGALLTNFAGSYAKYQACSLLMPASKCYKLYCDPEGIQNGQITAYVDAPDPGFPLSRFDLSLENRIAATHPLYMANLPNDPSVIRANGRERYERSVQFGVIGGQEPPGGEIVIFELHIHDNLPHLGIDDIEVGFEFDPGDFVTIFTPASPSQPQPQFTTYDHTQLDDVPLILQIPEPNALVLVIYGISTLGWTCGRRGLLR